LILFLIALNTCAIAQTAGEPNSSSPNGSTNIIGASVELARHKKEASSARLVPARMGDMPGIAVRFEGTEDLHYYASADTAPAGYRLKVDANSDVFTFGDVVYPQWGTFFDKALEKSVEVYSGNFSVFVPIAATAAQTDTPTAVELVDVEVKISGIACTSTICLPPFVNTLRTTINWSQHDSWKQIIVLKRLAMQAGQLKVRLIQSGLLSAWRFWRAFLSILCPVSGPFFPLL
jgi:hypothetical protein